jgi:hypothetical protein
MCVSSTMKMMKTRTWGSQIRNPLSVGGDGCPPPSWAVAAKPAAVAAKPADLRDACLALPGGESGTSTNTLKT